MAAYSTMIMSLSIVSFFETSPRLTSLLSYFEFLFAPIDVTVFGSHLFNTSVFVLDFHSPCHCRAIMMIRGFPLDDVSWTEIVGFFKRVWAEVFDLVHKASLGSRSIRISQKKTDILGNVHVKNWWNVTWEK